MSRPPRISVLLPTHRFARFLPEAIDSVLSQDFEDFELLISDDASGDGSADIVHDYAKRDPRIRAHVQAGNLGMVPNWNWCLGQARGEHVKFVFGDDRLASRHTLGRLAALLDQDTAVVLAASARLVIDEGSRVIGRWNDLGASGRRRGLDVVRRALWEDRNVIGEPSCVMFRRAAAARGFDPRLRQVVDMEMWLHLLMKGDLAFDSEELCSFRRHPGQQSAANKSRRLGPTESLIVTVRYLDVLAGAARSWRGRIAFQNICHRRLYYSRKHSPRTAEIERLEAILAARIPPVRAGAFLFWHRLSKPFLNLGRSLRGLFLRKPSKT